MPDVAAAVAALAAGGMAVVVDPDQAGAPGVLMVGAAHSTPGAINALDRDSRGSAVLCLSDDRCAALGLEPLGGGHATQWWPTDTIDAPGAGASAEDRARTIALAANGGAEPDRLVRPGHVRPMRARPGGTLRRMGWTEAAVDLARAAGGPPAALISVILDAEGAVLLDDAVHAFASAHALPLVTIDEVLAHRWANEPLVERVAAAQLPTVSGDFVAVGFRDVTTRTHHLALVRGALAGVDELRPIVHHRCLLGDALGGRACRCDERLAGTLRRLGGAERGLLVYVFADPGAPSLFSCPCAGPAAERARHGERLARQIAGALGARTVGGIIDDGGGAWDDCG
jgi:3,4-dihydroxy 2-butanone 4-phosphate synthase/GTP cyclohydrolase II